MSVSDIQCDANYASISQESTTDAVKRKNALVLFCWLSVFFKRMLQVLILCCAMSLDGLLHKLL